MAEVRAEVWRRSGATTGSAPVLLDIDASLVEIHSEHKVDGRSHLQGRLRLPSDVLLRRRHRRGARRGCFVRATPEPTRWPTTSSVLDAAVGPAARARSRLGHRRGDDPHVVQPRRRRPGRLGGMHRGVSRVPAGSATSASSSPCDRTPRSPGPSWRPSGSTDVWQQARHPRRRAARRGGGLRGDLAHR